LQLTFILINVVKVTVITRAKSTVSFYFKSTNKKSVSGNAREQPVHLALSPSLSSSTAERGARKAPRAPAVGEGAILFRLRWPSGPRMCGETTIPGRTG
jgi:hypothetical protein